MAKSVLITGCSKGGIGDALAVEFHQRGLKVFATARDLGKVEHLKAKGISVLPLDVTSQESIAQAVATVRAASKDRLDYLVNNSGRGYSIPLLDADISEAQKLFDVNVFGVVMVTQAFAPLLIAAKGKVVNIGSGAGLVPLPFMGMYNASKAALEMVSDTLRLELAPFGVQVILVVTAIVRTKFFNNNPPSTLPDSSWYLPIQTELTTTMSGVDLMPDGIKTDKYAKGVVNNVLKANSNPWQWHGGKAGMYRFATTFFPHTFLDGELSKNSGLKSLQSKLG